MPIFSPLAAVVVLPLALGVLSVLVPQPASASAATDIAAVTFITRRKGISFSEMHQLTEKSLDQTFRDSTATDEACLPSPDALSASLFGDCNDRLTASCGASCQSRGSQQLSPCKHRAFVHHEVALVQVIGLTAGSARPQPRQRPWHFLQVPGEVLTAQRLRCRLRGVGTERRAVDTAVVGWRGLRLVPAGSARGPGEVGDAHSGR